MFKNIILVYFIVKFLVKEVSCNDAILSKLHQHGYKLKDVRIQLMSYDKKFYYFFELKPFKYNRTTTAHNGTARLKVEAKDKCEVVVQVYKFLSNEYRYFPIRFQVNVKKTIDSNAMGLRQLVLHKCGNMTSFYLHKDVTYHICNYVVDETRFPPLMPNGQYKLELTVLYYGKEVAVLAGFGEVYTPIPYPKK